MTKPTRLALVAALLCTTEARSQVAKPATKPAPIAASPAAPEDRDAEIYRAAKSAMTEAKNRAARADLSKRKTVLARETESRLNAVAAKYSIRRNDLDRIVSAGQVADGTAAKKSQAEAKAQAKARNREQLDAMGKPVEPPFPASMSVEQYRQLGRATGAFPQRPGAKPAPRPAAEKGGADPR